ncbi:MAG: RyR domain-containing protein [Thermoleophilaceae bacterium]
MIVPDPLADPATAVAALSEEEVEEMARLEHGRWCRDLERDGWRRTSGPKDAERRLHPQLVPWPELSEEERGKDRDPMRELPGMLARVGYRALPLVARRSAVGRVARVLLVLPTSTYRAHDFLAAARKLGVEAAVASDERQAMADAAGDGALEVDLDAPEHAAARIEELARRRPARRRGGRRRAGRAHRRARRGAARTAREPSRRGGRGAGQAPHARRARCRGRAPAGVARSRARARTPPPRPRRSASRW